MLSIAAVSGDACNDSFRFQVDGRNVMTLPADLPPDVPFSLTCEQCDAGMEIGSYEEAVAAGWTDIEYAPDYLMANFVGLCPGCGLAEQEKERR
jgi:hypothetical protein